MKQLCTLEVCVDYNILYNSKVIRSQSFFIVSNSLQYCPCAVTHFSQNRLKHTEGNHHSGAYLMF